MKKSIKTIFLTYIFFITCFTFNSYNSHDITQRTNVLSSDDPQFNVGIIEYSSYFGGNGFDEIVDSMIGPNGNIYFAGITTSNDLPVSVNAIQPNFMGGSDVFFGIIDGNTKYVQYLSYLGGSNTDHITSISVDSIGRIFLLGDTDSNNFPTSSNSIKPTYSGPSDIFLTIVSPDYTLLNSTYLGGSGNNNSTKLILNPTATEIFVLGHTDADMGTWSPLSPYIGSITSFIHKLTFSSNNLYSSIFTYYGGSNNDYIQTGALSDNGLIIAGKSNSLNLPLQHSFESGITPYQAASNGDYDGFIVHLYTGLLTRKGGSYLGGSNYDEISSIDITPSGDIIVSGCTKSTTSASGNIIFPTTEGVWKNSFISSNHHQFISKFTTNLDQLYWSSLNLAGNTTSIKLREDGSIVHSGLTNQIQNDNNHPGAFKTFSEHPIGSITIFSQDASERIYASGVGSSLTILNKIILAEINRFILIGSTNSPNFHLTSDAENSVLSSANDGFVLSMYYESNKLPLADFSINATKILPGMTIQFSFNGDDGNAPATYSWDFRDGTPNSNEMNPDHTFDQVGSFSVLLELTDYNGDKSYREKTIQVVSDLITAASFIMNATQAYQYQDVLFTFTGSLGNEPSLISWDFGDGQSATNQINTKHYYQTEGQYTIILTIVDFFGETSSHSKIVEILSLDPIDSSFQLNKNQLNVFEAIILTFNSDSIGESPSTLIISYGDLSEDIIYTINQNNKSFELSYMYSSIGNYTITLTIEDKFGRISSSNQKVEVIEKIIEKEPINYLLYGGIAAAIVGVSVIIYLIIKRRKQEVYYF